MGVKGYELKQIIKEKGLKTLTDFNGFISQICKDVLMMMAESEMPGRLGYDKYGREDKEVENSRNGHIIKRVNSFFNFKQD